ncbi:putative protein apl [Yersinia enterocolitica]|nr:putative protein apl [Yersinia enterocolitica]
MAALITIKIPRECVSPREFAQLEGLAEDTVRKLTRSGKLPIAPKTISPGKKRAGGPTQILYARYKEARTRMALGHSRFEIVIGA